MEVRSWELPLIATKKLKNAASRSMLLAWMKSKFSELLTPSSKLLASLVFAVSGLIAPLASGQQAILDKTTLGSSQNDSRDLENSLIVPKHNRIGKEKTGEVDLKTLQTKTSKDTPFQGNLMDLDLDWRGGGKLGKPHTSGDNDSKDSKTADAAGEKDAKVSKQADTSGDKDPKVSKSAKAGDDQNKDQKAKSTASEEKTSEKEKASASKPDGDR
jgi:hypothetical protein